MATSKWDRYAEEIRSLSGLGDVKSVSEAANTSVVGVGHGSVVEALR